MRRSMFFKKNIFKIYTHLITNPFHTQPYFVLRMASYEFSIDLNRAEVFCEPFQGAWRFFFLNHNGLKTVSFKWIFVLAETCKYHIFLCQAKKINGKCYTSVEIFLQTMKCETVYCTDEALMTVFSTILDFIS